MDKIKAWFRGALRSVTMWFNAIFAVVATVIMDLPAALPDLMGVLPPNIYKWFLFINIIGNMALRMKTKAALSDR